MRLVFAVLGGAWLAACPLGTAHAGGAAALIEWDAPEGCPGALDVYARLSDVLGREPDTLGKLSRVRGTVLRAGTGYRLVLEAIEHDRRSSRLFEASSCDELADAGTLAIALALAPDQPGLAGGGVGELTEPVVSSPAATQAPAVDREPSEPAAAAAAVGALVNAAAVIEYGALPRAAPGVAVGAGLRFGAPSLLVQGVWLAPQRLSVAPDREIELDLLLAGLRGCYELRSATPRLDACLGIEVGRMRARGLDLQGAREVSDLWLAAGAAIDARWALTRALEVDARAEPMLPLERKEYTVNGSDVVFAPSRISARLYLGLTISID
jgi:hypothetical protein